MSVADNVVQLPVDDDRLVLLKPGEYTGLYVRHTGVHVFKGPKLQVLFRLLEHLEIVLPRWYRVTTYKGRIAAPVHSDLVREMSAVLGTRIRHDRIPVASLADIPVRIIVNTVVRDSRPEPLAEVNRYSIISRIVGKA